MDANLWNLKTRMKSRWVPSGPPKLFTQNSEKLPSSWESYASPFCALVYPQTKKDEIKNHN
jgi:hypothetical protein